VDSRDLQKSLVVDGSAVVERNLRLKKCRHLKNKSFDGTEAAYLDLAPGFRGPSPETAGKKDQGRLVPNLIMVTFQADQKSAEIPTGSFQGHGSDGSHLVGFAVSDILFHFEFSHKLPVLSRITDGGRRFPFDRIDDFIKFRQR
jgi:hypothetical protein